MKIVYLMGKSASGKDSVFQKIREEMADRLQRVVLYTTRPIRDHEVSGREYKFIDEAEAQRLVDCNQVIEKRIYQSVYGPWIYMTVDDGQFQESGSYLAIGTLESYNQIRRYFGAGVMIPVYLELEDGLRLERAIGRERQQKIPKYEEMCRRFLADQKDFSEEKLQEAGITRRFQNDNLERCVEEILCYLRENL